MNDIIVSVNNTDISIKEYNGQRVVTFKDIDKVHGRPDGTARKRFNDNKEHFIESEDYYVINQPSEIRTLGLERPQGGTPEFVILLTESGYLLLVKSFTDELAWDIQRMLVKSYFKAEGSPDISTSTIPENLIRYLPKDDKLIPVVVLKELTQATGLPNWRWRDRLSISCRYGKDYVTLRCAELYAFKTYNNVWSTGGGLVVIFQSGMEILQRRYGIGNNSPKTQSISEIQKPPLLSESAQSLPAQSSELRQSFSALEVLAAQYKEKGSDEDKDAITKCFDMILSDIREKSLSR